jgi:hypothetical protein
MGGKHVRTAHRRTRPTDSRTPAATGPPCEPDAKPSAHARLFWGFPGVNRLRKRPAYAGVLRFVDLGSAKGSIFPPEPPLLLPCADATRLVEEECPRAVLETFEAGPNCGLCRSSGDFSPVSVPNRVRCPTSVPCQSGLSSKWQRRMLAVGQWWFRSGHLE